MCKCAEDWTGILEIRIYSVSYCLHPSVFLLSCVWLFAILRTVPRQVPLTIGFSRQEFWGELPCPPPGDLPDPGIELVSPVLQVDSILLSHQGSLSLYGSANSCSTNLWFLISLWIAFLPFRVPNHHPQYPLLSLAEDDGKIKEESEKTSLNSTFKKWGSWYLVPSLHANRWGNNGNSDRVYFLRLQNHCRWWLQSWN